MPERSSALLMWLAGLLLAACIQPAAPLSLAPTADPVSEFTPTWPTPTLKIPDPPALPPGINPLTGQPADPAALERRPLVVKISNAPPLVRPQAGIGAADWVFEHRVEGGLTRFSAVYYSSAPDRVGSIRSARLIDLELVPMLDGILAFSGASIGVEDRLNTSDFANRLLKGVLFGRPYYWRDESLEAPHNLFTNPNALWALAAERGLKTRPDLRGLTFSPVPPPGGSPQPQLEVRYPATRVVWTYDSASGRWWRSADGLPHTDANTGQTVTAANVVLLAADHRDTDIIESQWQGSISTSTEIALWGEGDAALFRDGQRYPARWRRPERGALLTLVTPDGLPLPLKPGPTWFQIVPPEA